MVAILRTKFIDTKYVCFNPNFICCPNKSNINYIGTGLCSCLQTDRQQNIT